MLDYKPREELIALIQRQESALAKSHDEIEALKAARQPLADSFVAPSGAVFEQKCQVRISMISGAVNGVFLESYPYDVELKSERMVDAVAYGAAPVASGVTVDAPELPSLRVITQLIHDAGVLAADESHYNVATYCLSRFARAVAAERDRCAKLATQWGMARMPEGGGNALFNFAEAVRLGVEVDERDTDYHWSKAPVSQVAAQPVAGELPPQACADPEACERSGCCNPNGRCEEAGQPVQQPAAVAKASKPTHEQAMAGYEVACRYGVLENRAFNLTDDMFAAFDVPVPAAGVQPNRELMQLLGMSENDDKHDIMAMAAMRIKRLQAAGVQGDAEGGAK